MWYNKAISDRTASDGIQRASEEFGVVKNDEHGKCEITRTIANGRDGDTMIEPREVSKRYLNGG